MTTEPMSTLEQAEFQTHDLGQAGFLLTRGLPLLRILPGDGRRRVFCFPGSAREVAALYFQNAPVPARTFFNATRDLKAMVHEL